MRRERRVWVLAMCLLLSACGGVSGAAEPPAAEPWQEAYIAVLNDIRERNVGMTWSDFTDADADGYQLYDTDKDGVPELIVEYGAVEIARRARIYTFQEGVAIDLTPDDGAGEPPEGAVWSAPPGPTLSPAKRGT